MLSNRMIKVSARPFLSEPGEMRIFRIRIILGHEFVIEFSPKMRTVEYPSKEKP